MMKNTSALKKTEPLDISTDISKLEELEKQTQATEMEEENELRPWDDTCSEKTIR
jgi:hypothetical protein